MQQKNCSDSCDVKKYSPHLAPPPCVFLPRCELRPLYSLICVQNTNDFFFKGKWVASICRIFSRPISRWVLIMQLCKDLHTRDEIVSRLSFIISHYFEYFAIYGSITSFRDAAFPISPPSFGESDLPYQQNCSEAFEPELEYNIWELNWR